MLCDRLRYRERHAGRHRPCRLAPWPVMGNVTTKKEPTYTIAPEVPGYEDRTGVTNPFASLCRMLLAAWSGAHEPND